MAMLEEVPETGAVLADSFDLTIDMITQEDIDAALTQKGLDKSTFSAFLSQLKESDPAQYLKMLETVGIKDVIARRRSGGLVRIDGSQWKLELDDEHAHPTKPGKFWSCTDHKHGKVTVGCESDTWISVYLNPVIDLSDVATKREIIAVDFTFNKINADYQQFGLVACDADGGGMKVLGEGEDGYESDGCVMWVCKACNYMFFYRSSDSKHVFVDDERATQHRINFSSWKTRPKAGDVFTLVIDGARDRISLRHNGEDYGDVWKKLPKYCKVYLNPKGKDVSLEAAAMKVRRGTASDW